MKAYVINLVEHYVEDYKFKLTEKLKKKFEVVRSETSSLKITNDLLILNGKVYYPDNCLVFNTKYYNLAANRLDLLKKTYLVDTYYRSKEIISTKEILINYLRSEGYLLSNICYNVNRNILPVIDENNYLPIGGNPTGYIGVETGDNSIGYITLTYFGIPINTLLFKLSKDTLILYNPLNDKMEIRTPNIISFYKDLTKFPEYKEMLDDVDNVEMLSSEVSNELRLALSEVYSFINSKGEIEIFNICHSEPLVQTFMPENELLERFYKIITYLLENNLTWEDIQCGISWKDCKV